MSGRVWWLCAHKSGRSTKVDEQPLPECTAPDHPPQEATSPPGATNVHWGHKVAPLPSQQCSQVMCILPQHWYLSIYLSTWKSLNPSPLENLCRVVSEVARALSRLTGATLTCAEPAIQVSPNTDQPPHHHHRHCHLRSKKTNLRSYILTVSLYYVPCKYFSSA